MRGKRLCVGNNHGDSFLKVMVRNTEFKFSVSRRSKSGVSQREGLQPMLLHWRKIAVVVYQRAAGFNTPAAYKQVNWAENRDACFAQLAV